jgi:hypothetical protein
MVSFLILSLLSTMTKDVSAARVKMASSCMLIFRQASLPVDRISPTKTSAPGVSGQTLAFSTANPWPWTRSTTPAGTGWAAAIEATESTISTVSAAAGEILKEHV